MKLVIEIPEAEYNKTLQGEFNVTLAHKAVKNGTPLDNVLGEIRAEIEKLPSELTYDGRRMIRRARVYDIIDKYRAESEEST